MKNPNKNNILEALLSKQVNRIHQLLSIASILALIGVIKLAVGDAP